MSGPEKEAVVAKRLMVLVGLLAMLLLIAAPAFAQAPGERVEATGALQYAGSDASYAYYDITDETTGASYLLRSDTVELGSYLDQRVDISGTLMVEELFGEETRSAYVEVDQVEPAEGPDSRVRVTFELTVEGEPPANAVFVGLLGGEPVPLELTDPDGDGVYTYSTPLMPASVGTFEAPARIAQSEGPVRYGAVGPYLVGPITTIKDFGLVTPDENTTLSATVSFEESQGGAITPGPGKPKDPTDPRTGVDINEDGSVDEADGEAAAKISDSAIEAARSSGQTTLPVTGGVILLPFIAGLSVAAAGLLVRRATR